MHIDQVIETVQQAGSASPETKFVIHFLQGKKEEGTTEMSDTEVLDIIKYITNSYEKVERERIYSCNVIINNNLSLLQELGASTSLSEVSQHAQELAICNLQREIDVREKEGRATDIPKALLDDLQINKKICNLPKSVKDDMVTEYGYKLFGDELQPEDLSGFPYRDSESSEEN